MANVWQSAKLQQPPRLPWGRLSLMLILLALVSSAGTLVAVGWAIHRYPNSWWAKLAPLTASTTNIVQAAKTKDPGLVPTAVADVETAGLKIARNQGADGIYRDSDQLGVAWPLSSGGWLLTINGAWPGDVKSLVVIPKVGGSQAITATVSDGGSSFIFLKTSNLDAQPLAIAPADTLTVGLSVWVVAPGVAFPRHLGPAVEPRWVASDQLETYLTLDADVNLPVGSAVVDNDGRFLGLLGTDHRIWPVVALSDTIKGIVQSGSVNRSTLGLRALDLATARVAGQPTAAGYLLGADDGQTAVAPKGPADKAGLKSGDIITAVNGQPLPDSLFNMLTAYHPREVLKVTFRRGEKEQTVNVTLGSS